MPAAHHVTGQHLRPPYSLLDPSSFPGQDALKFIIRVLLVAHLAPEQLNPSTRRRAPAILTQWVCPRRRGPPRRAARAPRERLVLGKPRRYSPIYPAPP